MSKKQYGLISARQEQNNTHLLESSLTLYSKSDEYCFDIKMTLYNYGRSYRTNEERYKHVSPPFSRFFLFENQGAVLLDENEENPILLKPGRCYFLTPGNSFHIIYHKYSILYYAHFSVKDQTGLSLFRHAPRVQEVDSADIIPILKNIWCDQHSGGILPLLSYMIANRSGSEWHKLYGEYELYLKFKPVFELLNNTPPAIYRVDDMAKAMNMTSAAFSRSFHSIMKISPKEYLTRNYFEKASELLCFSEKNVTEIALILGHRDIHNFFHAFKRITGVTPSEYRSSCKKDI